MRKMRHIQNRASWYKVLLFLIVAFFFSYVDVRASEILVREVHVDGLYSIDKEELLYLLDIRPGSILKPGSLKRGIKRAFLKGVFEDISVETDDPKAGVIKVRVRERDVIEKIKIKGNKRLSKKFLKQHLDLKEDSIIRYDLLDEIKDRLLQAVGEKGFPSADVTIEVHKTKRPYRVKVILNIDEGEPVIVKRIRVFGRPQQEVGVLMRLEEGDIYDQFKLRKDMERIRKYYLKRGYLDPIVGPYTFKDGELHLGVNPGKRLFIKIKGNEFISSKKLRRVMPFFEAGDVRDDLIDEAVSKIIALYHAAGYPFVQVAPVISQKDDEVRLNFYIFEGEKIMVESIKFSGITIPETNLKKIMSLEEKAAFNPDLLEPDVETIKEFYIALGYLDVSVDEPEVSIIGSWAKVNIHVTEGEKFEITSIGVEGVKSVSEQDVLDAIGMDVGAPYNEVDISDARRRVLAFYRSYGFYNCRVDVTREFNGKNVHVVFKIDEGPRLFFGKTIVRGNTATKLKVIKREFAYREGMPLNNTLLMTTRQKLYKLGLFTDVDVKTLDRYDDTVDALVDVEEGKAGAVEFGFGYGEYERFRSFIDISYKNLFGMNRHMSFRTELNSMSRRYILNYKEPWFLDRPVPMRVFLMREERKERNIDTGEIRYRVKKYAASTGIEKRLSERTKFDVYYEFSLAKTFDVQPDVILSKEDSGTLAISSIRPAIAYDTRDNPFDPQRGVLVGMSVKVATSLLFSETDFVKVIVQGSGYQRLAKWLVFAVSLRGGAAEGLRDTEELPLVERFFLGGRNTVRGFEQDTLGPLTRNTPTGGNAFLLGNLELRWRVAGSWRVVTFLDAGNVWIKTEDIDPDDLRYTAGLGIRYSTPVGPIRIDYGQKLDRRPGESKGEIHFSIGHAF
jgi:outer membrane protein insertion porin family